MRGFYQLEELRIKPEYLEMYAPPMVWKGDSVGHIGINDLFFWVVDGECFLTIDSQSFIVKPGQLAYLPKGKKRIYTHTSNHFVMYEMAFSITSKNENIMDILGLTEQNFVVDITDKDEMNRLFSESMRKEMYQDPLYNISWGANLMSIISIYTTERRKMNDNESLIMKPVIEYMTENISKKITTASLAALVYMQPTYFIKRFKRAYSLPPINYFNQMKMYKAMGMLAGGEAAIEDIAAMLGFSDASYFSRLFKKHCGITPSEYRTEFRKPFLK